MTEKKIIWVTGVLRRTFVCETRQPVRKLSSKSSEDEFCTCCRNVSQKTTVLFRTSITQMIFFNQGMLLLGSNYVPNLNNYYDELMTIMAEKAMKPTMILTVGIMTVHLLYGHECAWSSLEQFLCTVHKNLIQ